MQHLASVLCHITLYTYVCSPYTALYIAGEHTAVVTREIKKWLSAFHRVVHAVLCDTYRYVSIIKKVSSCFIFNFILMLVTIYWSDTYVYRAPLQLQLQMCDHCCISDTK